MKSTRVKTQPTYHWHHVELHGHGDDIQTDDSGDGQIKVLRSHHLVDDQPGGPIVHVVRALHHFYYTEELQ